MSMWWRGCLSCALEVSLVQCVTLDGMTQMQLSSVEKLRALTTVSCDVEIRDLVGLYVNVFVFHSW